jgi:hypothetical protein
MTHLGIGIQAIKVFCKTDSIPFNVTAYIPLMAVLYHSYRQAGCK